MITVISSYMITYDYMITLHDHLFDDFEWLFRVCEMSWGFREYVTLTTLLVKAVFVVVLLTLETWVKTREDLRLWWLTIIQRFLASTARTCVVVVLRPVSKTRINDRLLKRLLYSLSTLLSFEDKSIVLLLWFPIRFCKKEKKRLEWAFVSSSFWVLCVLLCVLLFMLELPSVLCASLFSHVLLHRLFLSSFCLCFRRPLSHVVVRTLDTEHFLRPLICNKSLDATSPFSESCYFSCLHNENDVTKKDVSRHGKECTPDCLARKKTSPVCDYFLHSSFLWTMFVLLVFPTPLFRDHCLTDEDVKTTKWSPWPKEEVPHDFPFVLVISGVSLCL